MHKRFDTGKQPYEVAKDTQATAHSQKPLDFVRLSSQSTRDHPRLLGGIVDTDKPVRSFLTDKEIYYMNQHQDNVEGSDKGRIIKKMYNKLRRRYNSTSSTYSEKDIIDDLNKTRQGPEYKNAFGYNTLYDPNDREVGESSHQLSEDQTTQPESEDDRFRDRLLQSLAQHYTEHKNGYLDFSHFKASVYHFNYVRKTNYSPEEMVHLLHEEEYLT